MPPENPMQTYERTKGANRRSMPLRRVHQRLPHWAKVLVNWWMKRYGDPGDPA